jgi:hypothetical protein
MKPLLAWLWAAVSAGVLACSADPVGDPPTDGGHHVTPPAHDASPASCTDAGVGAFLPCDVEPIVAAKCRRCHDEPAALESCLAASSCLRAPFPLKVWADTRRNLGGGARVVDFLAKVIESGEMPYRTDSIKPPVETLTAAEKSTLVTWANACAPGAATACSP